MAGLVHSNSLDLDVAMPSDAELEAILRDAEAFGGVHLDGGAGPMMLVDAASPTSHMDQPGLFGDEDAMLDNFQQLQNQFLSLQPQGLARASANNSGSTYNAEATRQDAFLSPPRPSHGGNSVQPNNSMSPTGGFWAGKLSTANGAVSSVFGRMVITKERPTVAIED